MKRLLFIVLLVLPVIVLQGASLDSVEFNEDNYIKVFSGKSNKVAVGDAGELFDRHDQILGQFKIIAVDDFDSIARVQLPESSDPSVVKLIKKAHLKGHEVRFDHEDSPSYFIVKDKGAKQGVKPGMKGRLFKGDTVSGIFKIVGVEDDFSYAVVTNGAVNVDPRQSNGVEFQDYVAQIVSSTGFVNLSLKNIIMLLIGIFFIYLGVAKDYEPLLLVPIGFGILVGNIPLPMQIFNSISVYMIDPVSHQYTFNTTANSVLGLIYFGVRSGLFPPLIFLGIGAMTDFTALLANPKSVLLGAAAQMGIFITFISAMLLGFSPSNAAAIGIIGGADGPTAIFLSSKLAPSLIGPIAIAAYSYMAMVPIIQPPIMKLLTSKKERLIRMKPGRKVKKLEKIMFPIAGLVLTTLVAPGAIPLLGMLFFGNLLKESGVTTRLAKTASNALIDIATILLGFAVGASTSAQVFLNERSVLIFVLGVISFGVATASGVLFAKFMNLFVKEKINPLIGAAGVSAVPDSARVVHNVGKEEDSNNYLLMHAMGPNVAGVIGSAIAAGVFLGIF